METHILFFILAGLLITVLVSASIWSARREKSRVFSNTFSTRPPATPIPTSPSSDTPPSFVAENLSQSALHEQHDNEMPIARKEIEERVSEIKISLPGQAPSEPSHAESITITPEHAQTEIEAEPAVSTVSNEPQIITLYVVAAEGQQFRGDLVVPNLEAVGLQFGEYQIFHRHFNNDATSPVQFSAANMMQPGVFDLNNLEHFTTVGLVFFMPFPSHVGNDLANLKLMIRTVESLAQSLGGFVLNDQHQIFDDVSRQNYLLRVHQP